MVEDKKLYSEFLAGDNSALDSLLSKYRNNVIYFITRYIKDFDAAEDIFQDIALYIFKNKEKYNSEHSFKTYLYIIARSRALNYLKSNSSNSIILDNFENTPSEAKLLEDIILSKERKNKIQNVISKLKPNYQIVIYLTQIEGLTYKETAKIMQKTEKQIRNLVYTARKSLKKLLLAEKVIEIKHNKFIRLLSWLIIIGILTSGIVIGVKFVNKKINNAKLTPSFSGHIGNIDENKVWVGTFQLAWNELMEKLGGPIEFEYENSELANDLNKRSFTKDNLNENSYYIAQGFVSSYLKQKITSELKNQFNFNSEIFNTLDWTSNNSEYFIYSMLIKKFTFKTPFVELRSTTFGDSQTPVKYFGADDTASEEAFEQVTALFYNSETDFAIKIDTLENEELILYRTSNITNFSNTYTELTNKTQSFNGRKNMLRGKDILKIPFINVNSVINYDDLCGKTVKNSNGIQIKSAIQTVDFSLNNYGGNLTSEGYVDCYVCTILPPERYFDFSNTFVLYLKEKDKNLPYFALLIDDNKVLLKD